MKALITILTILLLSSCSDKVLFTVDVRNQMIDGKVKLKATQFYINSPFELRHEIKNNDMEVRGGVVKSINGKRVNILSFYRYTPCVLRIDSTSKMYLEFEGGERNILPFAHDPMNGEYRLDYNPFRNTINYSGISFDIINRYAVKLMVSKRVLNDTQTKRRVVRGVKVNQN